MAEGVFQDLVNQAGLADKITVDSAGTSNYHVGEAAHSGTLNVLQKHGIEYRGRARQLNRSDFQDFNYILAMDEDNLMDIRARQPHQGTISTIKLFLDYAEGLTEREVPDPYYNGKFDLVYSLVENGAQGLLKAIREEHEL
jgi:protein-tyrosine phosphatase